MKIRNNYLTPNPLTHLSKCEILVFGANIKGEHKDGAAKIAYEKFGAEWGVSNGPTGQCYAIPTIGLRLYEIEPYIKEFVKYAKAHKENRFLLTLMGCEQGAHNYKNLAPLFRDTTFLLNVTSPNKMWYIWMMPEAFDGCKTPDAELYEEAPSVINEDILNELCIKHRYEIGTHMTEYLPKIKIRYVLDNGKFGYKNFGDFFFWNDGGLYVWETDDKFAEDHNQDVVEDFFVDECEQRGYCHRAIYAGVQTNYKDSKGQYIYTGDVIKVEPNDGFQNPLALASYNDIDYGFPLDNHFLLLSECKDRKLKLTRVGTVFYQLSRCDLPLTMWQRAGTFNYAFDTEKDKKFKALKARFTPNFDQEDWKYIGLDGMGAQYNWDK